MVACAFANQVVDSNPVAVIENSDIAPVLSKDVFEIQAITEYRFTLRAHLT